MELKKEVKTSLLLTLSPEDAANIIYALQDTQQIMCKLDNEMYLMPTILKKLKATLNQKLEEENGN